MRHYSHNLDSIKRYSADGTRVACALAGDSQEDANFTTESADAAVNKIYTIIRLKVRFMFIRRHRSLIVRMSIANQSAISEIERLDQHYSNNDGVLTHNV